MQMYISIFPFLTVNTEIKNMSVLKEVVGLYIRTGQCCTEGTRNAVKNQ